MFAKDCVDFFSLLPYYWFHTMMTNGQTTKGSRTQVASVGAVYLPASIECAKQGHTLFASARPSNLAWARPGP